MHLKKLSTEAEIKAAFAPLPVHVEIGANGVKRMTVGPLDCPVVVVDKPYYGETIEFSVPVTKTQITGRTTVLGAELKKDFESDADYDRWVEEVRQQFPGTELEFTKSESKTLL